MTKLAGKIIIKGKIVTLTGLHIGSNKANVSKGGISSFFIKNGDGVPYIPGSSLKGKLRSLLGKAENSTDVNNDSEIIKLVFGQAAEKAKSTTCLYVRDCFLDTEQFKSDFVIDDLLNGASQYTQVKEENSIDRTTGASKQGLRQIDRVPANAQFDFELIYNVFDKADVKAHLEFIKLAMELLELDYLGGSGSRGYGKIKFVVGEKDVMYKKIENNKLVDSEVFKEQLSTFPSTFKTE